MYTMPAAQAQHAERPASSSSHLDQPPTDFDSTACPIIGRHFFGIEPLRPIGAVVADVVANLRRKRQVQALHRLGPRVLDELLAEIDPKALALTGGDRFPPVPMHGVST